MSPMEILPVNKEEWNTQTILQKHETRLITITHFPLNKVPCHIYYVREHGGS